MPRVQPSDSAPASRNPFFPFCCPFYGVFAVTEMQTYLIVGALDVIHNYKLRVVFLYYISCKFNNQLTNFYITSILEF
jgi:hypothetical protein